MQMKNYTTTCKKCGRGLNPSSEVYYNKKTRRYLCAACGNSLTMRANEKQIGLKRSAVRAAVKIAFGIICILPGEEGDESIYEYAYSVLCGALMIIWAVLPYVTLRKLGDRTKNIIDISMKMMLSFSFIVVGISCGTAADIVSCTIIGLAVALAGMSPYIAVWKAERELQDMVLTPASLEVYRLKKCLHCGATSTGERCEYCGSAF